MKLAKLDQPGADELLFKQFCRGNQQAFQTLFKQYKAPLYTYCLRMVGESDRAGDAFQEAFFRAIKYRKTFDPTKKFSTWLFSIARNECRRVLSKERAFVDLDDVFADESDTGGLDYSEKEAISEALMQLPPAFREVILLYEYEDLSYEQIAEITNVSLSLVKVRIHRARKQLRTILQPLFRNERRSR